MKDRQAVLKYLKKHPEQNNTVGLLVKELNLTRSQVRGRLMQLEYMKLVFRSSKIIKDASGIARKTYVYSAV
jgi:DNA-binding MarR family transcriptional regulator